VQLLSSGNSHVACIQAAPSKVAPTSLASRDGKYVLSFSTKGVLQLASPLSQAVVYPALGGATPKVKATSLCLAPNGTLLLLGGKAGLGLWQSTPSASAKASRAAAPATSKAFVATITSQGQVTVLNSQCAQVYPTRAGAARPPQGAALVVIPIAKPPPKEFASRVRRSPSAHGPQTTSPSAGGFGPVPKVAASPPWLQLPAPAPPPATGAIIRPLRTSSASAAPSIETAPECLVGARKAALAGSLCGGSSLCGQDGPCSALVCCSTNGHACRRRNAYTWMCLP
jgi:hypothetical protein